MSQGAEEVTERRTALPKAQQQGRVTCSGGEAAPGDHKGEAQREGRHRETRGCCSPGSILGAAVDIRAVLEEVPHDAQPAPGTGLVQGTVTRVVTVVHVTRLVLQTIQNHLLQTARKTDERRVISRWVKARISLLEGNVGGRG